MMRLRISLVMGKRLQSLVQSEHVGIVKGHHVPISAQNYHALLMQQSSMAISCARFFTNYVALTLVEDNFGEV